MENSWSPKLASMLVKVRLYFQVVESMLCCSTASQAARVPSQDPSLSLECTLLPASIHLA